MNCLKWRNLCLVTLLVCVILIIIGVDCDYILLVYIGFCIAVLDLMLLFFKWRCPHCNRYLSSKAPLYIKHCPWCGKELQE